MGRPRPFHLVLVLASVSGIASAARAAGVPELGCSSLDPSQYFGVVQEEDCAPGDEATCFDQTRFACSQRDARPALEPLRQNLR